MTARKLDIVEVTRSVFLLSHPMASKGARTIAIGDPPDLTLALGSFGNSRY